MATTDQVQQPARPPVDQLAPVAGISGSATGIPAATSPDRLDRYLIRPDLPARAAVKLSCPYHCGWHRGYTNDPEWMNTIIDHPLYGLISEKMLVMVELRAHDCYYYTIARATVRQAQEKRRKNGRTNPSQWRSHQ